jgi:hypothetical protein
LAALAAGVVLTLGGCASGADPSVTGDAAGSTVAAVPADEVTLRIAEVEAARQCAVTAQTFADEADITADLDSRLAAVGVTHDRWKEWHDALVDSPGLVAQLAEVSATGCAGA